jgi:hypothetical protein
VFVAASAAQKAVFPQVTLLLENCIVRVHLRATVDPDHPK